MSERLLPDCELAEILLVIRQLNDACAEGRMSWETRRAITNALAPGIGSLDTETKGKGKTLKKKEGTKTYRVSLP